MRLSVCVDITECLDVNTLERGDLEIVGRSQMNRIYDKWFMNVEKYGFVVHKMMES